MESMREGEREGWGGRIEGREGGSENSRQGESVREGRAG